MLYKDALKLSMNKLAEHDKTIFLGYSTKFSKANNTLNDVSVSKIIETPTAENLMMGMAIGFSLRGYRPVVYFERFDFVLIALDAIVNHLDKIKTLSDGQYDPKVIIRIVVGSSKNPLFTAPTHYQDFTEPLSKMVSFPVIKLKSSAEILKNYEEAAAWNTSMILIEERDLYNHE